MAVMSLPPMVPDFEGEISHVVVAGNETLIFIKPSNWQEEWNKIDAELRDLESSLQKITSFSDVKSGEINIVNVKGSFERAYIIRRPSPDTYSIYLIDKGMQCEIQFGEIYEFPSELLQFGLFSCVCPVLVPSAEQLNIYKNFVGHKCKCIVESVSKSAVVMGFVRGRLLIENEGYYEDLQDLVFGKIANNPGSSGMASAKLHVTTKKVGLVDDSSSSSSDSSLRRSFTHKAILKTNAGLLFPDRKNFATSKKETCDKPVRTSTEFLAEHDNTKSGTLFNQTAFKQYKPEMVPIKVAARFDKRDRMLNTFWVVNKKVFTAAERALKEVESMLMYFPPLLRKGEDIRIRQIPCIVRARADNAHKSLYRAVPAQYDSRTKRLSVFLVDFGWFKWVLANDIVDISTMDKYNPVRHLPVAMIHCREDTSSTLHAKNLTKGADCEIIIKEHALRDVYTVDLVESSLIPNRIDNIIKEQSVNGREAEMISSCKKLITETCQRQLMTSMMMETLNIANRELTQHPRTFWPTFCPPAFPMAMPMMMPMAFPVMFPLPVPNTIQGTGNGDSVAARPENTATNSCESVNFSNNNSRTRSGPRVTNNNRSPRSDFFQKSGVRFQSNNSQSAKEWLRNDINNKEMITQPTKDWSRYDFKNEFGVAPSDKNKQMPRNSSEDGLSWDLPPKYTKERRKFQKSWDNNMQKDRLTGWEKAVAADRAELELYPDITRQDNQVLTQGSVKM
ncbi:Lactadherin [Dirofilaria immitis]